MKTDLYQTALALLARREHSAHELRHKLLDKGQNIESVLESLSMGMMKKMLNGPLRELNHSDEPQRVKACEAVKQMFLRP